MSQDGIMSIFYRAYHWKSLSRLGQHFLHWDLHNGTRGFSLRKLLNDKCLHSCLTVLGLIYFFWFIGRFLLSLSSSSRSCIRRLSGRYWIPDILLLYYQRSLLLYSVADSPSKAAALCSPRSAFGFLCFVLILIPKDRSFVILTAYVLKT
jgi:hypothetical protein